MSQERKDRIDLQNSEFSQDPKSDVIGKISERALRECPKSHGLSFLPKNTPTHHYYLPFYLAKEIKGLPYDERLRFEAIFNYWKFVELIELEGGIDNFEPTLHHQMCDFSSQTQALDNESRFKLGLVPRGHLKSTLGTKGYCLWRIYRNPNIRICVGTATTPLAKQFVIYIKQYLENAKLQDRVWNQRPHIPGRLVPILDKAGFSRRNQKWDLGLWTEAEDKKIVWRGDAIQVLRSNIYNEPTVLAASPGSNITGMHFDLIILDDIINDDTVATPEKREKTLTWTRDLESVIIPLHSSEYGETYKFKEMLGDEFLVWGTRYHIDDYYKYLIDNKEDFGVKLFFRNVYKNGENANDGYLWEPQFNEKTVTKIRKRQGIIRFSAQYLNKVVTNEEVIFPTSRINYILPSKVIIQEKTDIVRVLRTDENGNEYGVDVKLFCVIDPAISQKKTADFSVAMIGGLDFNRTFYCLDFKFGRFLPDELIKHTYELLDKWGLNATRVETVGYQLVLIQAFKGMFHKYRPITLIEYKPKGKKEDRIKYHLQPLFDNDQIVFMQWMRNCKELMDELEFFPSIHDDILDAAAMIVEIATPTKKKATKSVYDHRNNVIRGKFIRDTRYGGRLR